MDFNNKQAVDIYAEKTDLFPIEETIFNQYLKYVGVVLDLGCGTGRTTKHIAGMWNYVIGTDISPLMIEKAKELHPDLVFEVQDACSLPYEDAAFDAVVFSFNGLDYIYPEAKRIQALREIKRVLAPGGVFIFSTHTRGGGKRVAARNWRRKPRRYKGFFMKERTVYGDLITYYGKKARNLFTLKSVGFRDAKYYDPYGKSWRYYVAWV